MKAEIMDNTEFVKILRISDTQSALVAADVIEELAARLADLERSNAKLRRQRNELIRRGISLDRALDGYLNDNEQTLDELCGPAIAKADAEIGAK